MQVAVQMIYIFFMFAVSNVGVAHADRVGQNAPPLDAKVAPISTFKPTSDCRSVQCDLSVFEAAAIGSAMRLYKRDAPTIAEPDVLVSMERNLIFVSLSPECNELDCFPSPSTSITYVFDSSGKKLVRRIYNK